MPSVSGIQSSVRPPHSLFAEQDWQRSFGRGKQICTRSWPESTVRQSYSLSGQSAAVRQRIVQTSSSVGPSMQMSLSQSELMAQGCPKSEAGIPVSGPPLPSLPVSSASGAPLSVASVASETSVVVPLSSVPSKLDDDAALVQSINANPASPSINANRWFRIFALPHSFGSRGRTDCLVAGAAPGV